MRRIRRWRPPLRIAWRDVRRAKGRSVLVLVLIALPVIAVTALDVVLRTADVDRVEGLDRDLGSADALVDFVGSSDPVEQDPYAEGMAWGGTGEVLTGSPAVVRRALGEAVTVAERRSGQATIRTEHGLTRTEGIELDLTLPLTEGLYPLVDGRPPRTASEVVIGVGLADRGFVVGSSLPVEGAGERTVVGLVGSGWAFRPSMVVGLPGSLALEAPQGTSSFLVDTPDGVSWAEVLELNQVGALVLSRDVVLDPPPDSEVPMYALGGPPSTGDQAAFAVGALIAAMALLEIVLLAGPAFAVGARRQQRSLALMSASGAEPSDVRRTVLASGMVLGGIAAGGGAVLGVGLAAVALPFVQRLSDEPLGPFDVSSRDVVLIACCGWLSAVLAALVPAVLASRQDVVAVLAGRRGDTRASRRFPILGVALLALGVAGSLLGARGPTGDGALWIAASAIVAVLGMVLLIPLVVTGLSRLGHMLPLPMRFAVRDAARHRARTTPAVAAVAATVAGVVATGIAFASDEAEALATYEPRAPMGAALIQAFDQPPETWAALERAVRPEVPDATVTPVRAVLDRMSPDGVSGTSLAVPYPSGDLIISSSFGSANLVADRPLTDLGLDIPEDQLAAAERAIASGGMAVFGGDPADRETTLRLERWSDGGEVTVLRRWTVPSAAVSLPQSTQPAQAILAPGLAERIGLPVGTAGLLVTGVEIDQDTEADLSEAVAAVSEDSETYVERGYHDNTAAVLFAVLFGLGAVLMLGGTLTATFLALSDARPDFATMAAVGAAPRVRRRVASAYAASIGLLGAALGATVGFIPGIAITYPLTSTAWLPEGARDAAGVPDHFLDVPWLLVAALVVGLPLLTAAVVGLTARSRLPMVSRLT